MYCQYCGKKISEGVRACPYCGNANPVNPENAQKRMEQSRKAQETRRTRSGGRTKKRSRRGRWALACIPAGVLLVLLAAFLFARLSGKTAGRTGAEAGTGEQLRPVFAGGAQMVRARAALETARAQGGDSAENAETAAAGTPPADAEPAVTAASDRESADAASADTAASDTALTGTAASESPDAGRKSEKLPEKAAPAGGAGSQGDNSGEPEQVVLAVSGISASSVREYDVQYYDAEYVLDGDPATAWSEGVAGYGKGEYLELRIPAGTVVTGGEILPGFYKSEDLFYRNGAPTNLTISSGGHSCSADVTAWAGTWKGYGSKCTFLLARSITSDGTVRVEIGAYRSGTQYDDTMISELRLTGYSQDGTAALTMPAIETAEEAGEAAVTGPAEPAAPESASEEAGALSIRQDVQTDARMTYGALSAKYGSEAQMVHGLHWNLPVNGLPYEIEFMAGGFSEDGLPCVSDSDPVWHVGGPLRILMQGIPGSFSGEELADRLRSVYSDVSFSEESGAGTGYYLSDRFAAITFADADGRYWILVIDQTGGETLTGDSYAWIGLL